MKQIFYSLLLLVLVACSTDDSSLIYGKWKICKVKMNGKDISKSSDPRNENGFEFLEDGTFVSFGNKGHQDKGKYRFNASTKELSLVGEEKGSKSTGECTIEHRDTINLYFEQNELKIRLYRMK